MTKIHPKRIDAKPMMTTDQPCRPPLYYRGLIYLGRFLYRCFLWFKKSSLTDYTAQINDRFMADGFMADDNAHRLATDNNRPSQTSQRIIWCHAVSVGEINTVYPLLVLLLDDGFGVHITNTTETGYQRSQQLFADQLGKAVSCGFVPFDDVAVIERFIGAIQPTLAIFVETELWANILYCLKKHHIASVMVNARLSYPSFRRYRYFGKLSAGMMDNLSFVIAQDLQSASHFKQLGLAHHKLSVAPSLKWVSVPKLGDTLMSEYHRQKPTLAGRFVWTAGSTHDSEEHICLDVQRRLIDGYANQNPLLIIVPRHPKRFDDVYRLCMASGLVVGRESVGETINDQTQVYLADSMGRLLLYYRLCAVAFVGGSMIDKGGHTPIEPVGQSCPVVMGQYTKNTQALIDELGDVVQQVADADELYDVLAHFVGNSDKVDKLGRQGRQMIAKYQTAHVVQYRYLSQFLER